MSKSAIELSIEHQKIFDEMFKRFNISAKDLAGKTGVSEGMISRFRQGKSDLTALNFIKLLLLVPSEARTWYISQIFGLTPGANWKEFISQASPQELADILRMMADCYVQRDTSKDTDSAGDSKAV